MIRDRFDQVKVSLVENKFLYISHSMTKFIPTNSIKTISKNILSLSAIRFFDMILPLMSIPYLLRVLGVEGYGRLAFSMAFIAILRIFVTYGFSITASRDVSLIRNEKIELSGVISRVLFSQILIFFIVLSICLPILTYLKYLDYEVGLIIICLPLLVTDALSVTWYYLGVEKMAVMTLTKFVARGAYLAGLLLFVKDQSDIFLIPLIDLCTGMSSAIFLVYHMRSRENIVIKAPSMILIYDQIKIGFNIFVNQLVYIFQEQSIPIILGVIAGERAVGIFSPINRFLSAATVMIQPISLGLFPYFSRRTIDSPQRTVNMINLSATLIIVFFIGLGTLVMYFAPFLIQFLYGQDNQLAERLLTLSAILPGLIGVRRFISIQGLVGFKKDGLLMKISLCSLFVIGCLSPLLISHSGATGAILARMLAAIVGVTMVLFFYYRAVIKHQGLYFTMKIF